MAPRHQVSGRFFFGRPEPDNPGAKGLALVERPGYNGKEIVDVQSDEAHKLGYSALGVGMMLDPEDKDAFLAKGEAKSPKGQSGRHERLTPPRVLLIDDESSIRVALRRFFGRMGWDVAEAADGRKALDLLLESAPEGSTEENRPRHFDMVLSDVRMPGLTGIQLHERLKEERPDILPHLVFSTGDIGGQETVEFVRDINCPVIQKPFRLSLLKELAERLSREAP
ncbi:MAG TPA: response regulator [Gemmatimonadaceae bacterium]|nr:response regulator [Gemmatimonadaceae bacterium]